MTTADMAATNDDPAMGGVMRTDRDEAPRRHWWPEAGDRELIVAHLDRQHGLPVELVRLDTGEVVRVGQDAEGEDR